MNKIWPIFLWIAMLWTAQAQDTTIIKPRNLVYNPSFEDHIYCPRKIDALGVLVTVEGWYQPTKGSADYFNECGSKECGIPNNKLGIQETHSGSAYCGIYCSKNNYREYLQTQLKEPLKEGQQYQLSFYVSLSEYSPHIVATLGGLFTKDRISDTTFNILMRKQNNKLSNRVTQTIASYLEPQVVNPYDSLLNNTTEWKLIQGTFTATGGEEFLTIGNFYPAAQSNFVDRNQPENILPGAYYYIDDVSVICLDCQTDTQTATTPQKKFPPTYGNQELSIGGTIVLKNIFFEFDKSTILQQSYNELCNLIEILEQYPKLKIEISGHTDNKGSAEYNQRLSNNRAYAVMQYLINKGIDSKRLSYKGYGKTMPIDTNDTEEGRSNNRRVEFKVITF